MNNLKTNINFLKNIIEKRETYIRFSPLGTAIMGIMYIIYYFLGNIIGDNICKLVSCLGLYNQVNNYLFIGIGILGIIIVTLLSLVNSGHKGEELLPKSIRFIIINLAFIGIILFSIIFGIKGMFDYLIPLSFLFYGLLIIVSRFSVPFFIKYYGFVIFLVGLFILWFNPNFIQEIILIIFGFGHLVMAGLLFRENK